MTHKIIVLGIGPGDPAYLLPKAQKMIEKARILVGGRRALADYSHSGARECAIGADIPGVLAFIREALAEDDVVVMVSGDPGYYSLLDALRRTFPIGQIEVVPGISSLQLAFARLALPWHDARLPYEDEKIIETTLGAAKDDMGIGHGVIIVCTHEEDT